MPGLHRITAPLAALATSQLEESRAMPITKPSTVASTMPSPPTSSVFKRPTQNAWPEAAGWAQQGGTGVDATQPPNYANPPGGAAAIRRRGGSDPRR